MQFHRIYAIILRYIFLFKHSFDRLSDVFYWPLVDLLLWGLTSIYIRSINPNFSFIVLIIMSGILFWLIVWRGQYEISVNLLEDLWNKNLINIFASPLKLSEWLLSFIILGFAKAIVSFSFAALLAFLFYQFKIFIYGFYLLPFFILLIITGWTVGFTVAGIILRFGTKFQTLAWTTIMIISPFSAIYYPIAILPLWAQKISMFIPTSYIFEGAREVIYKGHLDSSKIYISLILNCVYFALSLIFLKKSFDKVLDKGLVSLH